MSSSSVSASAASVSSLTVAPSQSASPVPPLRAPLSSPAAAMPMKNLDMDDASSSDTAASILLGVQALERQQQQRQNAIEALGVLALERQQAEVEARRRRSNSLSKSLTAPPAKSPLPAFYPPPQQQQQQQLRQQQQHMAHSSYPPSTVLAFRDPTVTTAATNSGSEGEAGSSFGHASANEWNIHRDFHPSPEDDCQEQLKRSGSVGRFLVRILFYFYV